MYEGPAGIGLLMQTEPDRLGDGLLDRHAFQFMPRRPQIRMDRAQRQIESSGDLPGSLAAYQVSRSCRSQRDGRCTALLGHAPAKHTDGSLKGAGGVPRRS